MNPLLSLDSYSADIQARIVDGCDEFESAWIAGTPLRLVDAVSRVDESSRMLLLRELLPIERHYREQAQDAPVTDASLLVDNPEIATELSLLLSSLDVTNSGAAADTSSTANKAQLNARNQPVFETFPASFGRYQLLRQLGAGGMGDVYLAEDTQLGRQVALKLPRIDRELGPQLEARFFREARAAATLNHPHLCAVYDVGEQDGWHYLTMEFIDGKSLADLLRSSEKWSEVEVARFIQKVAAALQEAHDQGVVHRDLKPANLMINRRGEPVVTDFGLALKRDDGSTQLTQHGQMIGTPAYMSPEQIEGDPERIGPKSDVYSLGIVMYELLTGQRPFQGSTAAIIGKIVMSDPPPMSTFRSGIDRQLENICRRMVNPRPTKRFARMDQVVEELTRWLERNPGPVASDSHSAVSDFSMIGGRLRTIPLGTRWAIVAVLVAILLGVPVYWGEPHSGQQTESKKAEAAVVQTGGTQGSSSPPEQQTAVVAGEQQEFSAEINRVLDNLQLPAKLDRDIRLIVKRNPQATSWVGSSNTTLFAICHAPLPSRVSGAARTRMIPAWQRKTTVQATAELLRTKALLNFYQNSGMTDAAALQRAFQTVAGKPNVTGKLAGFTERSVVFDDRTFSLVYANQDSIDVTGKSDATMEQIRSAYRDVLHEQSRQLMKEKEWQESLGLWKHLHSLDLATPDLYLDAAVCFAELDQKQDACQLLEQSLSSFSETADSDYFEHVGELAASLQTPQADEIAARAFDLALQSFGFESLD